MYNGQSFSDLIYQFYSMRIQFGYYTEGDTLPPIETLSRDFRVSTLTVKTALKQLRDEGYIITCGGKATKVNTSHADLLLPSGFSPHVWTVLLTFIRQMK